MSESVSVEISLMYRENNNGPRTIPRGTPDKPGAHSEVSFLQQLVVFYNKGIHPPECPSANVITR